MKRGVYVPLVAIAVLACSIPRVLGGATPNPPTETASVVPPTATSSPVPPTAIPPTPTPLPPVITAETVGSLSVARSFGEGIVRSVAFSPDGSVLAAAEGDPAGSIGTIRLYDPASGLPRRDLEGHQSAVWGLAFSPDGRYLASAGRDHTARVWDWVGGRIVTTLDFPNEVVAVAFSPDSRTLAVGGVDEPAGSPLGNATIWTYAVDTWQPQLALAEYWNIPDVAFTPDGSLIVGGGTSRNVRVWRESDGAQQFVLNHSGQVGSLAISPDGSTLATAVCQGLGGSGRCAQGAVWLWSLRNGKLVETLPDLPGGVAQVAYSVDGSLLFAASADGMLRAYSVPDYRPLLMTTASDLDQHTISDLAISADGRFIATGGSGGIDVWGVAR